jgi:hypothetical protein
LTNTTKGKSTRKIVNKRLAGYPTMNPVKKRRAVKFIVAQARAQNTPEKVKKVARAWTIAG